MPKRLVFSARGMGCVIAIMASCITLSTVAPQPAFAQDEEAAKLAESCSLENDERDPERISMLAEEGKLLYEADDIKLDGASYCSQAVALAERGEFRLSIRAASKVLHLGLQSRDENLLALAARDLAIAYSYSGNLRCAELYARNALTHAPQNSQSVHAPAHKILGDVYAREGFRARDIGQRQSYHARALAEYELALKSSSDKFKQYVELSLANAYLQSGQVAEASAIFERLEKGQLGDRALKELFNRGKGNLALAQGKFGQAAELFATAARADSGRDVAYQRAWAEDGLARTEIARGDEGEALKRYAAAIAAAETIRARFRSEEFKVGLFGDLQDIYDRAIAVLVKDAKASDSNARKAWQLSEQARARALLDLIRERVAVKLEQSDNGGDGKLVSLTQLQSILEKDEAMVEYHSLPERLLAWVIRPDGFEYRVVPIGREELRDRVKALTKAVSSIVYSPVDAQTFERERRELHRILIDPLALKTNERLVIIPHDVLHYLPFPALYNGDSYLVQRHEIALAPSARVAQVLTHGGSTPRSIVAFGIPQVAGLDLLPNVEREIRGIEAQFDKKDIVLGAPATRNAFLTRAGASGMLHVAAHAFADPVDPLHSTIFLAQGQGDKERGRLLAREVYGMNLSKVALVTLSACETARGRVARGDEVLGFTRAFFNAGASTLIASLWNISDQSTPELMSEFYTALKEGNDARRAMRRAQLKLIGDEKFSHPRHWAAFNLIGNWRLKLQGTP
jgi:CHAT domain-containing protein